VRAGFDAAPVLAEGDRGGVDAVHEPLVVRDRAEQVEVGEAARARDAVGHRVAAEHPPTRPNARTVTIRRRSGGS
jgi:hypothetical protein